MDGVGHRKRKERNHASCSHNHATALCITLARLATDATPRQKKKLTRAGGGGLQHTNTDKKKFHTSTKKNTHRQTSVNRLNLGA